MTPFILKFAALSQRQLTLKPIPESSRETSAEAHEPLAKQPFHRRCLDEDR